MVRKPRQERKCHDFDVEHAGRFREGAKDALAGLFRWFPRRMKAFEGLVEKTLREAERGDSVAFSTVDHKSRKMMVSTRFVNLDRAKRRVEVGPTWIAPAWERTHVNMEAKYPMLRHRFEAWQRLRVELKTDALNQKPRKAILRIGAKPEAALRKHGIPWPGRVRDTVRFSIMDTEWPEAKARLRS